MENLDADYYGLMHYRRYFVFNDTIKLTNPSNKIHIPIFIDQLNPEIIKKWNLDNEENLRKLIEKNDIIVPELYYIDPKKNTVKQYDQDHYISDYVLTIKIVEEKYPECNDSIKN